MRGSADFSVADLDAATRAEVKKHYIVAGDYLRRHSKLTAATDPGASASSLWMAARVAHIELNSSTRSFRARQQMVHRIHRRRIQAREREPSAWLVDAARYCSFASPHGIFPYA